MLNKKLMIKIFGHLGIWAFGHLEYWNIKNIKLLKIGILEY